MYSSFTTQLDALANGGGSLDPMGLYAIADRMATTLVPGVRERMSNLRYLTASAYGAEVCRGISTEPMLQARLEPYMALEFHLVSGWIQRFDKQEKEITGLPGIQKSQECYRSTSPKGRLKLNPGRYLKTASVFGFHGVYRTLATDLRVVDEHYQLGATGEALVEQVQRLFESAGLSWRDHLDLMRRAVRDTCVRGETSRAWDWNVHGDAAHILKPHYMSRREREILSEVLFSEGQLGRHELLAFLQSKKGQEAWTTEDERRVYVAFKESSPSKDTKNIVEAILAFEAMAKLLHDAFHQVLSKVEQGSLVKTKQLLSLTAVSLAAREVGGRYQEVLETMSGAGMEAERLRIEGSFAEFGSLDGDAEVFLDAMIHHHQDVQKSKGRNGKQAWIRRSEDDRWYADVLGRSEQVEVETNAFVHQYRIRPLMSFLQTLGHVAG